MKSLYRLQIIDHYKHPRHFTLLAKPTVKVHLDNPYCGDELTVTLRISEGIVTEVGWTGSGCALSMASASMLADRLKGQKVKKALQWSEAEQCSLVGVETTSGRLKCVLLGYQAVCQALEKSTMEQRAHHQ